MIACVLLISSALAENRGKKARPKRNIATQKGKKAQSKKGQPPAKNRPGGISVCRYCKDSKQVKVRCKTCRGSGVCPNTFCDKGMISYDDIGGDNITKMCESCLGESVCPDCDGTGRGMQKCLLCDFGVSPGGSAAACSRCDGAMTLKFQCVACRGTGDCINMLCENGRFVYRSLRGERIGKRCPGCKGQDLCLTCGGTGQELFICPSCRDKYIGECPLKEEQFMGVKLGERNIASSKGGPKNVAGRRVEKEPNRAAVNAQQKAKAGKKKAPAKKAGKRKGPAKKAGKKKAPAKKAGGEKAPAQEAPVKKAGGEKAPAQKAPVKKAPAQKAGGEKAPVQKAPAQKAPVKKAPAKNAAARNAVAKRVAARKAAAKNAAAKKAAAKNAPAVK